MIFYNNLVKIYLYCQIFDPAKEGNNGNKVAS